tara:strand:+ start:306 stop:632 length:327 start_codon:yes stop_codon:yes gene_type:complete
MNIEIKINEYKKLNSYISHNQNSLSDSELIELNRQLGELNQVIISGLNEVKSKIQSEIDYDQKFLNSLDPSDEWESRKIEEFENSIYEKNKDISFLDERIKSWGFGVR